eukprot:s963_g16.t2
MIAVQAVIMLSRQSGYKVLLEILRKTGRKHGFKVATLQELSDFNDARRNLRGERFRVLVAETSQAGEGIQFKHVRRLHLVEVPARHSDLVQRASRCVRMGGHEGLPPEERELAIEVHLVQLPSFLKKGPSSFIYRELLNAREVMSIPGAKLEAATSACARQLKKHSVKTLADFRRVLQGDEGKKLIELLTEALIEGTGSLCIKGDRRHCLRTVKVTRVTDTKVSTMDFQTWDADCDRSFEMALPPRWEFRDRAFGSPGIWRPFHEAVSSEINTLVRRGQRRGTVSINGADFAVDLHDMVAMPTEQYAALKLLYQKYADELPPADHPGGPDGVAGEKFLEFFRDLEATLNWRLIFKDVMIPCKQPRLTVQIWNDNMLASDEVLAEVTLDFSKDFLIEPCQHRSSLGFQV